MGVIIPRWTKFWHMKSAKIVLDMIYLFVYDDFMDTLKICMLRVRKLFKLKTEIIKLKSVHTCIVHMWTCTQHYNNLEN